MNFKYVYRCQRCGVVFEGKKVRDTETSCEFLNPSHKHEHVCGPSEYGVGHSVGYNVIDEAREEQAFQHRAAHEAVGRAFGFT